MAIEYFRGIEENERAGRFWLRGELPVVATTAMPASCEVLWVPADTPAKASGIYKDVRITYKTNAHGWRSREIDPASPNKKIMFVGCSYTMGTGLPYEDVWTSIATRHIEAALGEPVEQHNFGYGAHGNDFFAMVVHQVLPILKPDFLVVLFSDLSRRTFFPKFGHRMALLPTYVPDDAKTFHKAFLELQCDSNDFMDFARQHSLIDAVANVNGIPWVWQSKNGPQDWPPMAQTAKYVRTDNMIDFSFPMHGPWTTDGTLKHDFARDGSHPGPLSNRAFGLATAQFILGRGFGAKERA